MKFILKTAAIIFIMAVSCLGTKAKEETFRTGATVELSPSDRMQRIYFDRDGLMWICTNDGLKSYDGYSLKTYKSNVEHPQIFPNNFVMSVTDDHNNHIWIGTRNGIVRMDRPTGEYRTYNLEHEKQRIIYELYTTRDGTVCAGTDGGLSMYDTKHDRFVTFNSKNSRLITADGKTHPMPDLYSVKSIQESNDGKYLYLGTWNNGLLRMRRGTNVFHQLLDINGENNAFTLCTDSKGRLWIGTWRKGVVCLQNPDDFRQPDIVTFNSKTAGFNSIYRIQEHNATHTVWLCSRYGTHIIDTDNMGAGFREYNTQHGGNYFAATTWLEKDKAGNIWMQERYGKIRQVITGKTPFSTITGKWGDRQFSQRLINSVFTDNGYEFFASLTPYGLMKFNRRTGITAYDNDIEGFGSLSARYTQCAVTAIMRRKNGEIWIASDGYGIMITGSRTDSITKQNTPLLPCSNITALHERSNGEMWVGTKQGLALITADGKVTAPLTAAGKNCPAQCEVRNIAETHDGTIWISTEDEGVISIDKDRHTAHYSPGNGKIAVADIVACHEDRRGWLWAISTSGGLLKYDAVGDRFTPVSSKYHIAGDKAYAINEDSHGNIYITTDKKLTKLMFAANAEIPQTVTYTKEDGLGDIIFMPNCTASYADELFFGVDNSIVAYNTESCTRNTATQGHKLIVTDIRIDDRPYVALDESLRNEISEYTPAYTRRIVLPSGVSKLSVEFALPTYVAPEQNKYAYKLEGYNSEWQYRDAATRNATFENLPAGTYRLKIKARDSKGEWTALPYDITVRVLPPWWLAWWAYLVYIIIGIGSVWFAVRAYKQRLNTQNKLQMQVVFTNITHELLTPLAVISASIDNLRHEAPQGEHSYAIMQNNIDRLTRLLREILEVRKAQAGKLRLLAAAGDMSRIVENCLKNVMPVAMKKNIMLTSDIGEVEGWFDKDKVDTVIYNLLSNALKYTPEGKSIHVALEKTAAGSAVLTVSDRGIGISKEKMKHLYQRFLDADHRKTKISGTGIGLSLVHTLVKLHHGEIDCQSKEGEGTTFTVTLPLAKSAYGKAERATENRITDIIAEENAPDTASTAPEEGNADDGQPKEHSILLVEDNAELLELMAKALRRRYNVYTAQDGSKALKKIAKKELDVVITDVVMPVMDGIELVREIKGNSDTAQLPVIMLTAKTENDDRNEAYRTGADDYITKPFRLDDLRLRIDNIIANRERIRQKFSSQTDIGQDRKHCSSPDELLVQKAIEAVRAHIKDSGYGREELAADLCVSPSTLYNKLRALTGQNISGFINSIRMKTARAMIENNPHISVSELSAAVGFNTPNYFSKVFKQEYGMLPSELCDKLK